eukprot:scaffold129310_cov21-Tisochrysis_lutea.AAC.1
MGVYILNFKNPCWGGSSDGMMKAYNVISRVITRGCLMMTCPIKKQNSTNACQCRPSQEQEAAAQRKRAKREREEAKRAAKIKEREARRKAAGKGNLVTEDGVGTSGQQAKHTQGQQPGGGERGGAPPSQKKGSQGVDGAKPQ